MAWAGEWVDPPQALPSSQIASLGSTHFFRQETEAHREEEVEKTQERQGGGMNEGRGGRQG